MRRFLAVAFLGLGVAAATDASAQGRQVGRRAGLDSARIARGDTAFRRRGPDSLRAKRLDSLRAAGVIDTARGGRRGGPGGFAPGGPGGRGGAGLMGIKLNDNEKDAVKTINQKYREELKQLREANKGTKPGQNPQLAVQTKAIMDRQQAEIRAALTAEHQAQFDANVAKMKERMAKGGGRRGGRPPHSKGK